MRCDTCHFQFNNNASDRRKHRIFHDRFVNGIAWKPHPREQIIFSAKDFRLIWITGKSPSLLRKRAEKLANLANRETQFDCVVYSGKTVHQAALIAIFENRAIGIMVLEPTRKLWKGTWKDIQQSHHRAWRNSHPTEHTGCSYLWVALKFRGQEWAWKMANAACRQLHVSREDLPWMPPFTEGGKGFLKKYCPRQITLGWVDEERKIFIRGDDSDA